LDPLVLSPAIGKAATGNVLPDQSVLVLEQSAELQLLVSALGDSLESFWFVVEDDPLAAVLWFLPE
jgi:hypothetical protein